MEQYIGIDVGKARLDVDWCGDAQSCNNTAVDIKALIDRLLELKNQSTLTLIICEATGGYEQKLVRACHTAGLPVHVAHPNKVKHFAKSKGLKAKTDKIDARLLSEFARVFKPEPDSMLLSADAKKIAELLKRREQLKASLQQEKNRLDKIDSPDILASIDDHIDWLSKQIKEIDKKLAALKSSSTIEDAHNLLTSIPSVGDLAAHYILATLPEIGKISHKKLAALVGVAPYNHDSGKHKGKRFILGGRSSLRRILYMCAITGIRANKDLKAFYTRLRANGKPAKVAIVAVIRKLLTMINSLMSRQSPWVAEYS